MIIRVGPPSLPSGSAEFVQAWEQKLLPDLVRILDSNVKGDGRTISMFVVAAPKATGSSMS